MPGSQRAANSCPCSGMHGYLKPNKLVHVVRLLVGLQGSQVDGHDFLLKVRVRVVPPVEPLLEDDLDETTNLEEEPGKGPEVSFIVGFVGIFSHLPSTNSWFEFYIRPLLARQRLLGGNMRDLKVLLENLEEQISLVGLD